jgi:hypothetical protein
MMATTINSNIAAANHSDASPIALAQAAALPWYIWCAAFAVTSVMIGGHWDISWHSSIGRDSFWTPAHMAIYLGGALSGLAFGYIILHTTFAKNSPLRESSVKIWGFRAPLGAFIAAWGGITMLTSAPFDNWWHAAYGLDVKILSPPHVILFAGIYAIILGTMILLSGQMNRATGSLRSQASWLFLYVTGIMLTVLMIMLMETTSRSYLHSSNAYIVMAAVTPILLAIGWRVTRRPFAATAVAGLYTFVNVALIQLLPLFPAEPKLGPVYQHVTHFIPPQFPILLIVPALALDLIWRRSASWNPWRTAFISGLVYAALLISVEWFFAAFLMTPAAANGFFGTQYLIYSLPPQSFLARHVFFTYQSAAELWRGFVLAGVAAVLAVRWGISRGNWMHEIQR